MLPTLEFALPCYEVLDEESIERIHDALMRILEEIGIDFRDDEAIGYWPAGLPVSEQCDRLLGRSSPPRKRGKSNRPHPRHAGDAETMD